MSQMLALCIIIGFLYIGDAIAVRTKAWIPSVFITAILFLIGYWTFLPKDIVATAGISTTVVVALMYLLITNMGTLLSLNELMNQWKTVVIALSGIVGIIILIFIIGLLLYDMNTVLVAIPPLVGGIVSSLIMAEGAKEVGLINLSVFAVLLYVMQGFAGYPLTSIMLQREGRRVLEQYRNGEWPNTMGEADESSGKQPDIVIEEGMPRMFRGLPKQYNTSYFQFFRLAVVGYLAYLASTALAPVISVSPFVLCLFFGVIAASFGFLERHPLQKANGFGFAVMGLMLFIFDTLNLATPAMLGRLIIPMFVLISAGVVGMFICSWIVGRLLGVSMEMAFAISLTALYGFPADYIITNEAINALTKDEKERRVLTSHMLGPMLVGGFVSVTIVSVILAGFFVGYLVAPAVG